MVDNNYDTKHAVITDNDCLRRAVGRRFRAAEAGTPVNQAIAVCARAATAGLPDARFAAAAAVPNHPAVETTARFGAARPYS